MFPIYNEVDTDVFIFLLHTLNYQYVLLLLYGSTGPQQCGVLPHFLEGWFLNSCSGFYHKCGFHCIKRHVLYLVTDVHWKVLLILAQEGVPNSKCKLSNRSLRVHI